MTPSNPFKQDIFNVNKPAPSTRYGQIRLGYDRDLDILLNVAYTVSGYRPYLVNTDNDTFEDVSDLKASVVAADYTVVKYNTTQATEDFLPECVADSVAQFIMKAEDNGLEFFEQCIEQGYDL